MIALVQRVREARVEVAGATVGRIGRGLLALVCAEVGDGDAQAERLVDKLLKLRVFSDDQGRMNRSLQDLGGGVAGGLLLVSQFTLAADTRKGLRPSFTSAAPPDLGRALFERVVEHASAALPGKVATGRFGAHMQVSLVNDGPVTFWLQIPTSGATE